MFKTARSTRISTQACTPAADSGPRGLAGPSYQPHGTEEAVDRRDLTDGEVSGPVKVTGVLPTLMRTQQCLWHGPQSTGSRPLSCMVER